MTSMPFMKLKLPLKTEGGGGVHTSDDTVFLHLQYF